MKKSKIVIVGAGSLNFGISCIQDIFSTPQLWGSEVVMVDINEESLEAMFNVAKRINDEIGSNYRISCATDRKEALPGADFVIVSIAVDRNKMWKNDFQIPLKYGIKHVLGENAGPGAVFHTMRNIPIVMEICHDIEKLCPKAFLLNFTNPESRICLAVDKYTNVKSVGLCHQLRAGKRMIGKIIDKDPGDIDVKAYGINHFTWASDIRDIHTGEDLYKVFKEQESTFDIEYEKFSRFLFHQFGLLPMSGDGHLGEFFPYAHEMVSAKGFDFEADEEYRVKRKEFIDSLSDKSIPLPVGMLKPSGEKAFDIINGMIHNTNQLIDSVNIVNKGCISNLPDDCIVDIPCVVSGNGLNGLKMGSLPRPIAAICLNQINVQHLVVDAAVTGDSKMAFNAFLIDTNVPSLKAARNIFDELMEINKAYLPQFN